MRHLKYGLSFTIIISLMTGGKLMAIEEAKYNLVEKDGHFEIREYESYLLAEVKIEGSMEKAGSQAFRPLFNYISGTNRSQAKVAMTSPVSQEVASEKIKMTTPVSQERDQDSWAVSFMMPASFTLETIPIPEDPRVQIREVPARRVAVIRYSGFWSEKGYAENKAKLEAWIEAQDLVIAGSAIWARFNAPFTPWFLRRNEVQIPVTNKVVPQDAPLMKNKE